MSSPEDRPGSWRAEPESAPASGGHVSPSLQPDPSGLDPLVSDWRSPGYPSEEGDRLERLHSLTDPAPEPPRRAEWPTTLERPTPRRSKATRRVRRTVRTIDPLSVLKLSLFFYAVFLVLWLLFVALLYAIADSRGLFDTIEGIVGPEGFVLWERVEISLFGVEKWAFAIGLTFAVLGSLVNAFLAFLYNVGADLLGGVEATFVERDA